MPMHDWTRVESGTYHNFRYCWIAAIMDRLNAGLLPSGFFAMAEQIIGRPETDVVAIQSGVTTVPPLPQTRFVFPISDKDRYARRANRIAIHHGLGEVVAVIELVSPGNKDRRHSLQTFVDKAIDLLEQQVNLLIVDPFPPGRHDPQGIQKAICDEFTDQPFELPSNKPLTLGAYQADPIRTAYVELIGVGDPLPDMPLFLEGDLYIPLPLEETYLTTWNVLPLVLRNLLEPPSAP